MSKKFLQLAFVAAIALGLSLVGLRAPVFADHDNYDPVTVVPVTIPLWGPTWDHSPVTVSVDAGRGVTQEAINQVEQAIDDWNHAIATIGGAPLPFLVPPSVGERAEIIIKVKSGGGMVQGQALAKTDNLGFFIDCKVNVSGKAFGTNNPDDTVLSIALQEIGHCLGLLHADNSDDVMFGTLQDPPNTQVSFCDLDGWAEVMAWLLTGGIPALPTVNSVSCGETPGGGGATSGDPATVSVGTDNDSYSNRETVNITVTVTDSSANPVTGAAVTVTLTTAKGRRLSGSGGTDQRGIVKFTYKVNAKRDGIGGYTVAAEACNNLTCATGETSFQVN